MLDSAWQNVPWDLPRYWDRARKWAPWRINACQLWATVSRGRSEANRIRFGYIGSRGATNAPLPSWTAMPWLASFLKTTIHIKYSVLVKCEMKNRWVNSYKQNQYWFTPSTCPIRLFHWPSSVQIKVSETILQITFVSIARQSARWLSFSLCITRWVTNWNACLMRRNFATDGDLVKVDH